MFHMYQLGEHLNLHWIRSCFSLKFNWITHLGCVDSLFEFSPVHSSAYFTSPSRSHFHVLILTELYLLFKCQQKHVSNLSNLFTKNVMKVTWIENYKIHVRKFFVNSHTKRAVLLFPGYLTSPHRSPYWICTQHPTCQWCPKRGLMTTGGQIPTEKHYHSFQHMVITV